MLRQSADTAVAESVIRAMASKRGRVHSLLIPSATVGGGDEPLPGLDEIGGVSASIGVRGDHFGPEIGEWISRRRP